MFTWFTGSDSHPPIFLNIRSSKTFIVLTVSLAVFTDVFLYAIIVPVLPFALTSRARVDPSTIQTWISIFLAVYGAAQVVASPLAGWVADRARSRRWPMLMGLVALLGSTVMLCFGRNVAVLAAGRVIQGCSAAIFWSVGLALLVDTVGSEEIGEAMGWVSLAISLATLVSPLLGGVVFARAGYYAVFAMAFAVVALDIFMRMMMVEKKLAVKWLPPVPTKEEKDLETILEDSEIPPANAKKTPSVQAEKGEAQVITLKVPADEEAFYSVTVCTASEISLPNPTSRRLTRLPSVITLLSSRRLLSALWCTTAVSILYTAMDATLPLFVKHTFHWTSTGAGLIFLAIFIPTLLGPIAGKLSDKYGPRWFATAGAIVACPALILLRLVHEDSVRQKILLCGLLVIIGACLVFMITPTMAEITYAVEAKTQRRPTGFFGKNGAFAQAYSLFNMAWASGSMIGPLVGGLTNGERGWGTSTAILGAISVGTAIPAVLWTGGSIFKMMRGSRQGTGAASGS